MPPRIGRGRTAIRSAEESRASVSDEGIQQNEPLPHHERQAGVEDVSRQIGEMELVLVRFQLTTVRIFQPVQDVSQPFQSPPGSQPSNHQGFRPRGKHFKKRSHSSSSGSVSSGGNSSGSVFCGQCRGKHETSQCRGVRGSVVEFEKKPAVTNKEFSSWTFSKAESAGSVVEFEKKPAVTNKEFSSWTFSKANPAADDLATQFQQQREIQQQREFQQQREIQQRHKLHLLNAKINISRRKARLLYRNLHHGNSKRFFTRTRMKVKKQKVRANHVECHQKFQARIHEAEDSMQAQHLLIEALVDEKDSLLQTIHGLQEANNAPAPFDGGRSGRERD
ncbi:ankyrin repeat-containing protein-like [Dorcoceras hygrometricum]|uniref:Ankyrin repeat-containing protein-like n=1 Tax=Dorcoceras hygrometricum TaxID=472368 RepID=A0A2Z7B9W9_9LAMI|nr:ankyrin repeat-containing protein-like [Dorcoceras hygrometricum]